MWAFLKEIQTNPIYLREQGRWGEPNQYYATLMRYLPLVILLVLGLSVMCGSYQFAQFAGLGEGAAIMVLILCLPNIVIQVLTWIGIILAPALTAPSVVEEMDRGSWEILRLTPISTFEIIVSKFLGSLSRLKIWRTLIIVSVIYALGIGVGSLSIGAFFNTVSFSNEPMSTPQIIGLSLISIISTLLRPWLEIAFAGLVGLTLSLWTRSARAALIGSYSTVVLYRTIINTTVWASVIGLMISWGYEGAAFGVGTFSLIILYTISCVGLLFLLRKRAKAIDEGAGLYE